MVERNLSVEKWTNAPESIAAQDAKDRLDTERRQMADARTRVSGGDISSDQTGRRKGNSER